MTASDEWNDEADKTSVVPSDTFKGKLQKAGEAPACLVCLVGPAGYVGKSWDLTIPELVIGRSVKAAVFVDDKSVSKSHAKIMVTHTDVVIMDLDSTNKTVINDSPLPPLNPYRLQHSDQIKTGNVIFKYIEAGSIEAFTQKDTYDRSQLDALTGAYGKGALLLKAPEALKRAEVLNEPLCIVVFDIDHFKKVNDTYGHAAGDLVLRDMCMLIKTKLVRSNDYFARYGGEEFVLLLSGSPLQQAVEVANRIRMTIEAHSFVFEGRRIPVTISAGVALRQPNETSFEEIFKRADAALYMSKKNGRNRVSTS